MCGTIDSETFRDLPRIVILCQDNRFCFLLLPASRICLQQAGLTNCQLLHASQGDCPYVKPFDLQLWETSMPGILGT